ncbi:Uma2 family endonuclease [Nocardioides halotolerans]|uniref:Uma2 family endonuclease n=1 Tax=Nocardioides halotolerans TaxID=433660 RepID=UPI000427CF50|nr:Uma2 family endonuclease [Nocardioides halotolerans]
MSATSEEPLLRVPMSWEEYLRLPEKPKAEWVDGVAVLMTAPPLWEHSDVLARLCACLVSAGPGLLVATDTSVKLPDNRVRRPDVTIVGAVPSDGWVTEPPLMVAEVLSRSTRSEDLVRKSAEYAGAGIGQYWLVDPELRTLTVMTNVDGTWEDLVRLDDGEPEGSVEVAGVRIPLDLRRLLRN